MATLSIHLQHRRKRISALGNSLHLGRVRASVGSAPRSAEAWRADRLFSQGASAFQSPALERVTHAAAGSRELLPVRPTLGVALLASTLGSPPAVASPSRPSSLISCHSWQDFSTPGREARRSEVKGWRAQTATCPSAAPPVTQPRGCRRTRAGAGGEAWGARILGRTSGSLTQLQRGSEPNPSTGRGCIPWRPSSEGPEAAEPLGG